MASKGLYALTDGDSSLCNSDESVLRWEGVYVGIHLKQRQHQQPSDNESQSCNNSVHVCWG